MPAELRVALLARPGAAATRLRDALAQAGAACVLDADPTSAGLSALVDAAPDLVVVALDPAVEDVIERFEPVLGDPRVDVIYEEADLVAGRDGWDLARWQRHLEAKLQRHGNVLPPMPASEDEAPEPIALPDADHLSLAEIADELAHSSGQVVDDAVAEAIAEATGHTLDDTPLSSLEGGDLLDADALSFDIGAAGLGAREAQAPHAFDPLPPADDVDAALAPVPQDDDAGHGDATVLDGIDALGLEARGVEDASGGAFDPVNAEELSWQPPAHLQAADLAGFDLSAFDAPASDEPDGLRLDASAYDAGRADDTASASGIDVPAFDTPEFDAPAFDAPAFDATEFNAFDVSAPAQEPPGFDVEPRDVPVTDALPATAPAALELALDDGDASVMADADTTRARFRHDLDALHERIATLELVDDSPKRGPEQARGAVLVMAGIGGPDAVRQLLGALPAEFPRPVLVQQRLDGGRYDKLVAQMQRAAAMTVRLAEPGQTVIGGVVYVLPETIGVEAQGEALRFTEQPGDLLAALPAADSAVLLFSGSDAALVDAAMNHKWAGAFVAGQTPDGCYDASAPAALVARGADTGQPADLARQLVERWT